MSDAKKKYIFQWKGTATEPAIQVRPSLCDSKEECWEFAKRWLRGATEKDSRTVVKYGEVVEYQP